jgi:predicted nuclease with RNAse H fold
MVYRGIRLRTELKSRGCEVIEVYPYASKIRLWGKGIPRKTTPAGLGFLKRHISRLIPSLVPYVAGFNHDLCDAAVAAYTAFLHSQGKIARFGDPDEGVIYLPLLDRLACDH